MKHFVNGREKFVFIVKIKLYHDVSWYVANPEGDEINFPPMRAETSAETDEW